MAEENKAMCERILTDIQHIFNGDHNLKEFTIVPITESRNKSPVLYEEHCLGLESWCVIHIYQHVHSELFQARSLLKRGNVVNHKLEQINKLLISALLLHPDVTTFWNMRRELIETGVSSIEKELLLTKLVLSCKGKSNECFTYRKWIINKLTKSIADNDVGSLLNNEFAVAEMAAEKYPNNYHAWSHRIWCIQNVVIKFKVVNTSFYLNMILSELDFSNIWISRHVSEHAGFHYRQYLCNSVLRNKVRSNISNIEYHCIIEPFIGIKFSNCDNVTYLNKLIGRSEVDSHISNTLQKCYNYSYYFTILLFDLLYNIQQLNKTFPGHEAIWCHRRFVIYSLIKGTYDYHDIHWKQNFTLNKLNSVCDLNIASANISDSCTICDGEKSPKVLKYDVDKVESSYLYKLIIESETKFIKENSLGKANAIQRELAIKHGKWLKLVLSLNRIAV